MPPVHIKSDEQKERLKAGIGLSPSLQVSLAFSLTRLLLESELSGAVTTVAFNWLCRGISRQS